MFTQGVVLRLKEGVELSSGNRFSRQPERTNPGASAGIWLAVFIALPAGLLSPAQLRLGDCSGVSTLQVLSLAVCGCCTGISQLRSSRLSGQNTEFCGSKPSYKFDLWVMAWFFSLLLFQLWSSKSFPELTHTRRKNRNATSTEAAAELMDSQSQRTKYPQVSATESNT